MRTALWLSLVLAAAGADAQLRVQVETASMPAASRGAWTEVDLQVISAAGGPIELRGRADGPPSLLRTEIDADSATSYRLPVSAAIGTPLDLRVTGPSGATWERSLVLDRAPRPDRPTPAPLPDAFALERRVGGAPLHPLATPLAILFVSYAALLVWACARSQPSRLAVLLPLGASAWLAGAMSITPAQLSSRTWVEVGERGARARYAASIRVVGSNGGSVDIALPSALRDLTASDAAPPLHYAFASEAGGPQAHGLDGASATLATHFLSASRLWVAGTIAWQAPLHLALSGASPEVENRGHTTAEPAFLIWHGDVFAIPPLAPEARWQASVATALSAEALPIWLAEQRRRFDAPALVIRGTPAALADLLPPGPTAGWIVVHAEASS